jgi:glycogen synthase
MKKILKQIEKIPFKVKEIFTKIDNELSQWECLQSSAKRYNVVEEQPKKEKKIRIQQTTYRGITIKHN